MIRLLLKTLISALVIALVSEIGKRSSTLGAILAALPLSSVMILTWLYLDTGDTEKVASLSTSIFWAIVPSFLFLLSLPWLLRHGIRFAIAMPLSCAVMAVGYAGYIVVLRRFGVTL
ncbi:MAG: DUF3147 family protein [Bdellovibrionales bacterium]|nr:DUF3147 family protein [Bdellovibrionales bacterium]